MTDSGWKDTLNLPETTTRATIYCSEVDKEEWDREVEEQGYQSRSTYLYELVQEARAYREKGFLAHHQSEERIQELENRVEQLQEQLKQARQDNDTDEIHIDQPELILQNLNREYQPLDQLLEQIVQSQKVKEQLRGPVENLLYTLAEQDRVEYERGHGWRLTNRGEE
jgi:flagellar biosynthesis chaperone FliJ